MINMNKTFMAGITLAFLLYLIQPASALYGGEMVNYSFAQCDYLTVNITDCVQGEWNAQGCIEQTTCNFLCQCSDNYILNLTPAQNSVGAFTIVMTNYFNNEENQTSVTVGNGGIINYGFVPPNGQCRIDGCSPGYHCIISTGKYWGRCLLIENETALINDTSISGEPKIVEISIADSTGISATTSGGNGTQTDYNVLYLIIIISIIAIIVAVWKLRKKPVNNTDNSNPENKQV
jgi:hypothetical protein